MERFRCSLLMALCFGLSSCTSLPPTSSTVLCTPEELYRCYSEVLEQVLPMDLFNYSDIVFRRYDTYARSRNPTEFVASLRLYYPDGRRVIEASYRRLLDENLYSQLSTGDSTETAEDEIAATINWSDGRSTAGECPAIADVWEKARILKLNDLSAIPPFDPESGEEDEIVVRLHARVYEVAFTVDDQTITVVQRGGPNALSDWVEESISVIESCNAEN